MSTRAVAWLIAALVVAVLAVSTPAGAVGFGSARLGDFYDVADAEAPVAEVARAVVFFGNATGFVVSPDGLIVTNNHVYESFGRSGTVRLGWDGTSGRKLKVSLVRAEPALDVALYQAAGVSDLPTVPLREAPVAVGEPVFVVGHPSSGPARVSYGAVLADGLDIAGRPSIEYSAQTWWGSSGSPVCDAAGRAVALHWGWDSEGKSHGRLTGVPVALLLASLPELGGLAAATAPSCGADDFSLETTLLGRDVGKNAQGRSLAALRLSLVPADERCRAEVAHVVFRLHPTFKPSRFVVSGDGDLALGLRAWGAFTARAEVTLRDGEVVAVAGLVAW